MALEDFTMALDGLISSDIDGDTWDFDIIDIDWTIGDYAEDFIEDAGSFFSDLTAGDVVGAVQSIPKAVIDIASLIYKNQSEKDVSTALNQASLEYAASLEEAAEPKNVNAPLGNVVYDPETGTYNLGVSEEVKGLMKAKGKQFDQVGKQLNPILENKGVAIDREHERMMRAAQPGADRETSKQRNLAERMGSGTASTEMMRAGMMGQQEANLNAYDTARSNVTADMTNYLNNQNQMLTNLTTLGNLPSDLANISTQNVTNALTGATAGAGAIASAAVGEARGGLAEAKSYTDYANSIYEDKG